MNAKEAQENVGKMVMSRDAGFKMVHSSIPRGPFLFKKISKAGLAVISKPEGDVSVAFSLIDACLPNT